MPQRERCSDRESPGAGGGGAASEPDPTPKLPEGTTAAASSAGIGPPQSTLAWRLVVSTGGVAALVAVILALVAGPIRGGSDAEGGRTESGPVAVSPTPTPGASAAVASPTPSVTAEAGPAGRTPSASPAATATPTATPTTPAPEATPGPDEPARSEFVGALIVAVAGDGELPALLEEHRNGVLGSPFRPGAKVQAAYRLANLRPGQTVRRIWLRDGQIVAESEMVWSDQTPAIQQAFLAAHLVRGGRWELWVLVDGELAAAQPFQVDSETLVVGELRFASDLLADGRPAEDRHEFAHGLSQVHATFQVFNAPQGLVLEVQWVHDGAVVEVAEMPWPGFSGPGSWQPVALPIASTDGQPLEPGDWRFVLSIDGEEVLNGLFKIAAP